MNGLDPYEGMATYQIIFAVGTEGLRPTIPEGTPPGYSHLISQCWDSNPAQRPNFDEIIQRLKELP